MGINYVEAWSEALHTTDSFRLAELAEHKDWRVRSGVASNINTLPETLSLLSNDEEDWVRASALRNPSIPVVFKIKK